MQQKKISKKKIIFYAVLVILILIAFITAFVEIIKDSKNIDVRKFNPLWFMGAIALAFLFFILSGSTGFLIALGQRFTISKKSTLYINLTEGFFAGITPFGSGAEPFHAYYYLKNGVSADKTTSNIIINFILYSSSTSIVGAFLLLFYHDILMKALGPWIAVAYVGWGFITSVFLIVLAMVYIKSFNKFIIWFLKLLAKIKPLRPKMEQMIERVPGYVKDFQKAVKDFIFKEHFKYLGIKIIKTLSLLSAAIIPFFVGNAIGITIPWDHFGLFLVTSYITNNFLGWVPTPGASGANEVYFYLITSSLDLDISKSHIFTIIFITRTIGYYLWMLFGLIFYIVLIFRERKFQKFQTKRTNSLLEKRYQKKPYNILYLTDDFNYQDIKNYENIYEKLNVNIHILARNIKNRNNYQNPNVKIEKKRKNNFKKRLKEIMQTPPEIMLTNTGRRFGFNARKYSYNIKAPLIFIKDKPLSKKRQLLFEEADLILANENLKKENSLNLNTISNLKQDQLKDTFLKNLNLYNIKNIEKLEDAKILILGGNTFLGREISLFLLDKTLSITSYQDGKQKLHKKIKIINREKICDNFEKIFRYNSFDIVIDCLNTNNETPLFYEKLLKELVNYNTNYLLLVDSITNKNKKINLIPKDNKLINTAKETNIINISNLELPLIMGGTKMDDKEDSILLNKKKQYQEIINQNDSFNLLSIFDFYKITEISLKNLIKKDLNDTLHIKNYFNKKDLNSNNDTNYNFTIKENSNKTLNNYTSPYTISDMLYLENNYKKYKNKK